MIVYEVIREECSGFGVYEPFGVNGIVAQCRYGWCMLLSEPLLLLIFFVSHGGGMLTKDEFNDVIKTAENDMRDDMSKMGSGCSRARLLCSDHTHQWMGIVVGAVRCGVVRRCLCLCYGATATTNRIRGKITLGRNSLTKYAGALTPSSSSIRWVLGFFY